MIGPFGIQAKCRDTLSLMRLLGCIVRMPSFSARNSIPRQSASLIAYVDTMSSKRIWFIAQTDTRNSFSLAISVSS